MCDFSGGQPVADRGTTPFEDIPHLAVLSTDGDDHRTGCARVRPCSASCS